MDESDEGFTAPVLRTLLWLLLIWLLALLIGVAYPREQYPGQYASSPQRDWYLSQLIPSGPQKGQSCCSNADGADAAEWIENGKYWASWCLQRHGEECRQMQDWMPVPEEVVLPGPNHKGVPVVWWGRDALSRVFIRCYAPGPGA